jgi:predicted RNA-binding Zn ribbon-like protein
MGERTSKFLFVGNHPCLDFINTQMIVKGVPIDVLEKFGDLVAWLVKARLLTESQADVTSAALTCNEMTRILEQAKVFRAMLRALAERIASRKSIPDSIVTTINQFLSHRSGYPQIVRKKGGFKQRFHLTDTPAQHILTALAESASDLLLQTDFRLIKKCANPSCILYFYDTTKNHTRNWCSMNVCGNRMKVAAHYRRSVRQKRESGN